jgi:hypothetical protein
MNLGGSGAGGITFQPTAGVLLGRLSSVQLRADVGYFFNTFGEAPNLNTSGTTTAIDRAKHYSHGFTFDIGIGF